MVPPRAPPRKNANIERLNLILQEKERNNQMLEQQLKALKDGSIPDGPDGLAAIRQFEAMLQAIPEIEKQVFNGQAQMSEKEREEIENRKKKKLKNDVLVNPIKMTQNQARSTALDRGEKVLINLQAQEYDQLRMINSFKPQEHDSELYKFKLKQYKELSAIRNEQLKEINTQKIAQIRSRFLNKGKEQDLEINRQEFNDMVERMRVARQLEAINNTEVPTHEVSENLQGSIGSPEGLKKRKSSIKKGKGDDDLNQRMSEGISVRSGKDFHLDIDVEKNSSHTSGHSSQMKDYNPIDGFTFFFDYVSRLFQQFNAMRFVFGIQKVNEQVIEPLLISEQIADLDPTNPDPNDPTTDGQAQKFNIVMFKKSNIFKGIPPHPMTNFIVEMQVPKAASDNTNWVSYGWTILNVFDLKREINSGIWKLPLYQSPVLASLDTRDINTLQRIPHTALMMRVANMRKEFDIEIKEHNIRDGSRPGDYKIPKIHEIQKFITEQDLIDQQNALNAEESTDSDAEVAPDMKYTSQGITVTINSINNYLPTSTTSIVVILYKGGEIVKKRDLTDCQFETTGRDYANVKDDPDAKKKSKLFAKDRQDKAFGRYLKINEGKTWENNFHKILTSDKKKQDMTLVLYIYESYVYDVDMDGDNLSDQSKRNLNKSFTIEERNDKRKLHGYAVMNINNEDDTLKYGNYDLNVFKPPINLKKRYTKDLIKLEQVSISLKMTDDTDLDESEVEQAQEEEDDDDDFGNNQKVVKEVPFIESKRNYVDKSKVYKPGDGIDIYIDQARYLPDSVTFTRLLIRGLTKNQTKVMNAMKCFSDIDTSTKMVHDYNFRFEVRNDNMVGKKPFLDPTTFLEIMIETIDRTDMNEKIVGFAYFPLFLALDGDQLPYDSSITDYIFNEGAHQMPIYYSRVPQGTDITKQNIQDLPKVFTSTVCLRAFKAPVDSTNTPLSLDDYRSLSEQELIEKKIIREPPLYGTGAYNNSWCQMERNEQHLFKFKHKRFNPTMAQIAGYLFRSKGIVSPQNESVEKILILLDNLFGKPSLFKPKLDTKYENSYEPTFGFRLSVPRLHKLEEQQKEKVHFVVTSMIPPGRLLQAEPSMGPDVHVFKDQDFESKWDSVQFDEEMNYVGLPGKDKLGILFEVKAYDPKLTKQKDVQSVGWAYLPLFVTVENENKSYSIFTNQGLTQLPLFGGQIEKSILISALKSEDPVNSLYMDKELTKLKTSILVRIHDNQTFVIPEKTDYSDLNTDYLLGKDLQKYFFNEDENEKSKSETIKYLNKELNQEAHLKAVKESIRLDYGFVYPKI